MQSRLLAPRRIPCQQRGRKRVAGLLCAAASVIAEVGYEPATMSEFAKRANSSIGSLYQFFPNKESVAEALRAEYVKEIEQIWASLAAQARALPVGELVARLIREQILFAEKHPAFLALYDAPPTLNTPRRRESIHKKIGHVIVARKPSIARAKALLVAAVVQELVNGLLRLYARSDETRRTAIIDEFAALLSGYLGAELA